MSELKRKMELRSKERHKRIPEKLERIVRWQYRHLGELVQSTYEQWEKGFLQDELLEREVVFWIRMTWAVLEYLKRHPGQDKKAVADVARDISSGNNPKCEVGQELVELWSSLPDEYRDVSCSVFDT